MADFGKPTTFANHYAIIEKSIFSKPKYKSQPIYKNNKVSKLWASISDLRFCDDKLDFINIRRNIISGNSQKDNFFLKRYGEYISDL